MTLTDSAGFTFIPLGPRAGQSDRERRKCMQSILEDFHFEIQKKANKKKSVMCLFWTHEKKIILGVEVNIIHMIYNALIITKGYEHCLFFLKIESQLA